MSELLARIAAEQLQARKDRDKVRAGVLTSLLGDASKLTAEDNKKGVTAVDDARVVATLKSFIANAEFTLEKTREEWVRLGGHDDDKTHIITAEVSEALRPLSAKLYDLKYEIKVLNEFMPSQLDENGLRIIIDAWKAQGKNLGEIMAGLKAEYGGRYDGKLASSIAKG